MTLEEALLEMEKGADYLVYRDAETGRDGGAGAPPRRQFRSHRGLTRRGMANTTDAAKSRSAADRPAELVIITGLSGSGKGSVLKALEDLGYYSVDNLPVDLIPKFAELTQDSASIRAAALVVDVREGEGLKRFPAIYARIRNRVQDAPGLSRGRR